jgi:hypothetical protein
LFSLTVTPNPVSIIVNGVFQFQPHGFDVYGNPVTGAIYTWTANIGSISDGLLTAQSMPGNGIVTAISGTISGSANVNVFIVAIDRIVIAPKTAMLAIGGTMQFSATAYDQFNNVINGVRFIWNSGVGTVDDSGLFTAQLTPGTGIISAGNGSAIDFANITIVERSFQTNIHVGWNLLSTTLVPEDTYLPNLLASIDGKYDRVLYFDTLDVWNPWKTYRVGSLSNSLTQIDNTMGFWLHAMADATLTIFGSLPVNTSIQLHAGWNLVGYPSMTPKLASDALASTGADGIAVYDGISPYIIDITDLANVTMQPGCGYWVHVFNETSWNVASSIGGNEDEMCSEPPQEDDMLNFMTQIVATTAQVIKIIL